jgi:protein subunit release factor B
MSRFERIKETILTKKDLKITPIRGSGPGGQHRNKNYTGIRISHGESGATGEATDSKSQDKNLTNAFKRLIDSAEFQAWLDIKIHPGNYKVEVFKDGAWRPYE